MKNLNLCSGMVLHTNRRVDLTAIWEVLRGPMSVGHPFLGTGDVHIA